MGKGIFTPSSFGEQKNSLSILSHWRIDPILKTGIPSPRMKRFRDLSTHLKMKFGGKVFKISLSAETTCPNIDGSLATGGCNYCNDAAFAPQQFQRRSKPVALQVQEAIDYVEKRHGTERYIAYFQSFTSTYGDIDLLMEKFRAAVEHPKVVGFALSTRPDCITREWAKRLAELLSHKPGWVELGLQTADNQSLARTNRWETKEQFENGLSLLKREGIEVCAHMVIGLPGEKRHSCLKTTRYLAALPIDGIKFHNLHVVKGTALAQTWRDGNYEPLTLEEYADICADCIERIPPSIVLHRFNAHAPRHLTLAPDWSINKLGVVNAVAAELERRDSWQGKGLGWQREEIQR